MNLNGKVAVIAGAVGNLGQAVVGIMRSAGARLALVDRTADRLSETFPDLSTDERHLFLSGVDAASLDSCELSMKRTLDRFDRIDVLVNTVGAFRGGSPVHESDPADWQIMFDANVRTALNTCRAAAPIMIRQRRGAIVSVSSVAALHGDSGVAAYAASKSAIVRLTESLSAELGPYRINVNCVLPGTLDTPQNRKAMPGADTRMWVSPESAARVIAFLCSDDATAINGASIPLTGSTP